MRQSRATTNMQIRIVMIGISPLEFCIPIPEKAGYHWNSNTEIRCRFDQAIGEAMKRLSAK